MGKLIDDFKRDMRANNEQFRQGIKAANQQFREGMQQAKKDAADRKQGIEPAAKPHKKPWRANRALIILSLIFFFPLGFYFIWKHTDWSRSAKRLTTGLVSVAFVGLMTLAVIFAPPSLALTSSLNPQADGSYTLTGKVDPGDIVTVNGKAAQVTNDTFTISLDLHEGNNDLAVVVLDGSKKTEKHFTIHRYTAAEIAEQKRLAAEKKAREEAARKVAAEEAHQEKIAAEKEKAAEAAAKKKQQQEALAAKQKAEADAKKAQQQAAARAAQQAQQSSGSGYTNSSGNYVPSPSSNPSGATAKCRDGTYSYSQHHSGTCSHHGGVASWL